MTTSPIVKVIQYLHPGWEPPRQGRNDWIKCLCPFHGDEQPSAAVSFVHNAFKCHACGVKGGVVSLIKNEKEVSYAEAKRISEELSEGCDRAVSKGPARKSSRRVFGDSGSGMAFDSGRDGQVHAGVRGRSTPWS
ncbi:DNA primase [Mycobacterium phage Anthony]|uniref:DNA primase n=1 Tax=Mycobacterium phage Anthony TaxID=2599857 RepID=A0A5J6TKA8_9CAUD|nr:DNA primase [Mycobacterium phage Anthony]QFG10427.1 DNA primase [Mycobacterium phage Anthony]